MSIHDDLIAPFPASEIEFRAQSCGISNGKPWAMVLAYVQARAIQKRLDDVFGWDGWTDEYRHSNGDVICRLGVLTDKGWIYKENGATNTDIEAFKGGISGAFKRVAASGYGIGRYLYNLEESFAECSLDKPKGEGWHMAKTKDKQTLYWKEPTLPAWALPEGSKKTDPPKPQYMLQGSEPKPACSKCNKEIAIDVHDYSVKKYGKPLCRDCQKKEASK